MKELCSKLLIPEEELSGPAVDPRVREDNILEEGRMRIRFALRLYPVALLAVARRSIRLRCLALFESAVSAWDSRVLVQ